MFRKILGILLMILLIPCIGQAENTATILVQDSLSQGRTATVMKTQEFEVLLCEGGETIITSQFDTENGKYYLYSVKINNVSADKLTSFPLRHDEYMGLTNIKIVLTYKVGPDPNAPPENPPAGNDSQDTNPTDDNPSDDNPSDSQNDNPDDDPGEDDPQNENPSDGQNNPEEGQHDGETGKQEENLPENTNPDGQKETDDMPSDIPDSIQLEEYVFEPIHVPDDEPVQEKQPETPAEPAVEDSVQENEPEPAQEPAEEVKKTETKAETTAAAQPKQTAKASGKSSVVIEFVNSKWIAVEKSKKYVADKGDRMHLLLRSNGENHSFRVDGSVKIQIRCSKQARKIIKEMMKTAGNRIDLTEIMNVDGVEEYRITGRTIYLVYE